MPALFKHMGQGGTRLSNFLVSTGVCCPARVSILTGKYAHCHKVTGNWYPSGAFQKFYERELENDWLPGWLQSAGYDTYLIGKFLNAYTQNATYMRGVTNYWPKGWNVFEALTKGTYELFNGCYSLNGGPDNCYPDQYQTDIIRDKSVNYIKAAAAAKKPFFMYVTPTAPHSDSSTRGWSPPSPATRHADLYANDNISLPKGDNWGFINPAIPIEAEQLTPDLISELEDQYLGRIRSLRAVDEMVDAIVKQLDASGLLDNTYIIYSSDNGLHLGQFSQSKGKALGVEEDVRVPFFIRGPGVPAGQVLPYQGNMIDIAPTLLTLAGAPVPAATDGIALPIGNTLVRAHVTELRDATFNGIGDPVALTPDMFKWWRRDANIIEAWDSDASAVTSNVVYKTLRVCTDFAVFPNSGRSGAPARLVVQPGIACYKYVVWCQGTKEFYDLSTDSYEVRNRINDVPSRVMDRMDGVLSALVHCRGNSCQSPYSILHPGSNVLNFTRAMDGQYDIFYRSLSKFWFVRCISAYVPGNERAWTLGPTKKQEKNRGATRASASAISN